MAKVTGKVAQIVGPVIDVEFGAGSELPKIYDSLEIKRKDGSILVLEAQQHVGEGIVRCIAMDSTDGLSRGYEVVATGNPIKVPVGNDIYGRWSYQILDGKNGIDLLIVSIYQCCSHPTNTLGGSAHNQQQIQFIDEGPEDTDPRQNFSKDLHQFLHQQLSQNSARIPFILGDWNEE